MFYIYALAWSCHCPDLAWLCLGALRLFSGLAVEAGLTRRNPASGEALGDFSLCRHEADIGERQVTKLVVPTQKFCLTGKG